MIQQQYDIAPPETPAKASTKGLLLWSLLIALGILGLWLAGPLEYQRQPVQWQADHQTLRGNLWLPLKPAAAMPGVILVHGVLANRYQTELAARTFAASGFAALSFDLRGYGASDPAPDTPEIHRQDVLSALAFLRANPGVNSHQMALIGHSMGAQAVIDAAAEDRHLQAVFAMGMDGEAPAQVTWVTGVYDALHPPARYQRVIVSPAANHQTEWYDLWLLQILQQKLGQSLGAESASRLVLHEFLRFWAGCLLSLGFLGLMVEALAALGPAYLRLGCLSLLLSLNLAGGVLNWLEPSLSALAAVLLISAYLLAGLRQRLLLMGLWLIAGLFLAHELVAFLRGLPWLLQHLLDLGWFALYLWQSLLVYPIHAAQGLKELLFWHSQDSLEPSWYLGGLLALEWMFPRWWQKLGQGLKTSQQRQKPLIALLALGLLLLAGLLLMRVQQGYFEADALQRVFSNLMLEILPTGLFFGLFCWLWGKHWLPPKDFEMPPR